MVTASRRFQVGGELISRRLRRALWGEEKGLAVRRQYKVAVRPRNDASYNCIKKRVARHSIEYLSFNFIPTVAAVGVSVAVAY